ncbi:unnamed protein product, partial [Allacma fusca]
VDPEGKIRQINSLNAPTRTLNPENILVQLVSIGTQTQANGAPEDIPSIRETLVKSSLRPTSMNLEGPRTTKDSVTSMSDSSPTLDQDSCSSVGAVCRSNSSLNSMGSTHRRKNSNNSYGTTNLRTTYNNTSAAAEEPHKPGDVFL